MLLFGIPDIRLFWSKDQRFLSQFKEGRISKFVPFSKYPPCYKDVAFWLKTSASPAGGALHQFHENDMMEVVRDVASDLVEDVRLVSILSSSIILVDFSNHTQVDEFIHPKTGRKSLCFRINYRSLEKTLTNEETNSLHEGVRKALSERYGVELR
jgi:phenylalanyl-tRNA synthetase alpha chain